MEVYYSSCYSNVFFLFISWILSSAKKDGVEDNIAKYDGMNNTSFESRLLNQ